MAAAMVNGGDELARVFAGGRNRGGEGAKKSEGEVRGVGEARGVVRGVAGEAREEAGGG